MTGFVQLTSEATALPTELQPLPRKSVISKVSIQSRFWEHFVAIGFEEIGLRLPMHYYPLNGLPIFGAYGCLQCATFYQGI